MSKFIYNIKISGFFNVENLEIMVNTLNLTTVEKTYEAPFHVLKICFQDDTCLYLARSKYPKEIEYINKQLIKQLDIAEIDISYNEEKQG